MNDKFTELETPDPPAADNKQGYLKRQIWYLPKPEILERTRSLQPIVASISVILVLIFLLLVWSSFASIEETAVTFGEITPINNISSVESLDGGTVKEILIKDGQFVKKGDVLIKFDVARTMAELQQAEANAIMLLLDRERLRAFIAGKTLTDEDLKKVLAKSAFNFSENTDDINGIIADEELNFKTQYLSQKNQHSILDAQLAQKKSEVAKLIQQFKIDQEQVALYQREVNMHKKLLAKGYTSEREYLQALRALNTAQSDLATVGVQIEQAKSAIIESESKTRNVDTDVHQTAFKELQQVNSQLFQAQFLIKGLNDKVKKTTIVAPTDGFVKGLLTTVGDVIQAGEQLMEIVPATGVEVETRISTQDVGFVKVGDPVKIKILTYDFARYGELQGKVAAVSATTFFDKDNLPYYKGTITLNQQYLQSRNGKLVLKPGMTVQADITTGEKTVLDYLLKPIHASLMSALHER